MFYEIRFFFFSTNPLKEANEYETLKQVKADVETQGDFVQSLASEVRASSFTNIDDLLAFVNWLDEELSFLVLAFPFN